MKYVLEITRKIDTGSDGCREDEPYEDTMQLNVGMSLNRAHDLFEWLHVNNRVSIECIKLVYYPVDTLKRNEAHVLSQRSKSGQGDW